MSTKSEKKEKQNKERKKIEIGIGSPTASAKRPKSPSASTFEVVLKDDGYRAEPKDAPIHGILNPKPKPKPVPTVFNPAFDMPERPNIPRRYPQEVVDEFEASFDDFESVPGPNMPLRKGGGYMYPALKNYMKRSRRKSNRKSKKKSKRKSKKKSKKNSKKNSKKKSKKAKRRR